MSWTISRLIQWLEIIYCNITGNVLAIWTAQKKRCYWKNIKFRKCQEFPSPFGSATTPVLFAAHLFFFITIICNIVQCLAVLLEVILLHQVVAWRVPVRHRPENHGELKWPPEMPDFYFGGVGKTPTMTEVATLRGAAAAVIKEQQQQQPAKWHKNSSSSSIEVLGRVSMVRRGSLEHIHSPIRAHTYTYSHT